DYSIQPYSPAAGTGLSSHELNQPGCYKPVKDTSVVAQFRISGRTHEYLLAWTTTPWTLPSNAALAVGENIRYVNVDTYNPYNHNRIRVTLAKETMNKFFKQEAAEVSFDAYKEGDKLIPFKILEEISGKDLVGLRYEQLMPYVQPDGDAFRVIAGDFVETSEGTGIVHIAPTFGADDLRAARKNNVPAITVPDPKAPKKRVPLVDRSGKFVPEVTDFAGRYVKQFDDDPYQPVDVDIAVMLKKEGKAFKVEKYEHNYPHCWRTDRAVLYYPLDSWFIRTTAFKDRMIELNNTINWKPASTGQGRFGNWLENLVDWNLSRSRFWATPLPVWQTEDEEEQFCIGSVDELEKEVLKAVDAGLMAERLPAGFDLHLPYVDDIILVSPKGRPMYRVPDVVDVWFDSGAMPYAQWHYPFENKELFKNNFPADFIAEGVDQTRGWFFTLHALAVMLFDSVAYKTVVSNGLVLDKNGNKMSKRLGNAVEPFQLMEKYGADAARWYMVHNTQPWDNMKFDKEGVDEVRRKFFGTLYNVYSFFALYANIDSFTHTEEELNHSERPEIDRWILSLLHSLIGNVQSAMDDYEPTKAVRAINDFVIEDLSNWYVRLCRRRFWKGEYTTDKISAYQTLYDCLETVAKLAAPFAPFMAERVFTDLNEVTGRNRSGSVHLSLFPVQDTSVIDKDLEERMSLAQQASSLVLSLRKKARIRVRQPLQKIMIPALDKDMARMLEEVRDLVLSEVNVKDLLVLDEKSNVLVKKVQPDFKKLGPKYGARMKQIHLAVQKLSQQDIAIYEQEGSLEINTPDGPLTLEAGEMEILSQDIPGWMVASEGRLTLALDITITDELRNEGIARELVNRIQNLRKDKGLEVTDHISVRIEPHEEVVNAVHQFKPYICSEILADELELAADLNGGADSVELEDFTIQIQLKKI
ncbi:MAG: isoleucine--tRNA ligase, partial [Bacteroidota bacterium]|nr:isoleucine--tRNA ligase [Bacteroidota bacterium]